MRGITEYWRLSPSCHDLINKLSSDSTRKGKVTFSNLLSCLNNVKNSEEKSQPHEISDQISHVYRILLNSGSKVLEKKTVILKDIFLLSIASDPSANVLSWLDKMDCNQGHAPTQYLVLCASQSYSGAETKSTIQKKYSIDRFRNELKQRIHAVEAEKQKTIGTRRPNLHSVQCRSLLPLD
ncbi:hypothetical protein [Erwinia pyrifoliae]|uniref:hypothetical protein n=1 Tax=Erwinia pyrifoliae TaxID=79967 RepID=UPI000196134E|nr:hypothetical protein [Erwinia pyrifoliae]AUX71989.1 hypothetical protein CPI84_05535 [Erwinia pyrifoliae]MCA8877769.1 hypothetical protein [Erwinia pyrifoliae]UWS30297.1 hypothetical protein NYP81_01985 [Erwinia pyrifoliae]UXK13308.1 hypothetical protein NYP80_05510 [Erwinia pyrifoliae]CAX56351.1 uncharacterized protein EpC_25720 [Erwinia pyrifoliae Ep1/96]